MSGEWGQAKIAAPGVRWRSLRPLIRDLGFDELGQEGERFLPAEAASLGRNGVRNPFLYDVQLSSAEHLLQGNRRLHRAGKVRIVELVRVADALVRRQLEKSSAKGVAFSGGEIRERHPVGAA